MCPMQERKLSFGLDFFVADVVAESVFVNHQQLQIEKPLSSIKEVLAMATCNVAQRILATRLGLHKRRNAARS